MDIKRNSIECREAKMGLEPGSVDKNGNTQKTRKSNGRSENNCNYQPLEIEKAVSHQSMVSGYQFLNNQFYSWPVFSGGTGGVYGSF